MNTDKIKDLLRKYYEGETDLREEKILRHYFQSDEIPSELSKDKMQFLYYSIALKEKIGDTGIEQPIVREKTTGTKKRSLLLNHHRIFYSAGIAATILLLFVMAFLLKSRINEKKNLGKLLVSQELVYNQAHDILALVSANLNKGIEKMEYIGKFDQAMQKMELLSKYYQYQSIIINPDQLERSAKNK
jgi:hypothetical protein